MKRKYIWLLVIFIYITTIAICVYIQTEEPTNNNNETETIPSSTSPYYAEEEKANAIEKMEKGNDSSDIITNDIAKDKYLGLSFSGLSDSVTNQKILSLLDEYNRKATFFVPAVEAVECADDIADMIEMGHDVGNNTLNSRTHMEKMTKEELVNDFCVSNKVIKSLSDEKSPLLMCNATVYTDDVLKTAHACGNPKVVYCTHFINYQSFTSYSQVFSYINKIPYGTILTIKMNGVLDEIEMEDKEVDEDPAKDMQATLDPEQKAFLELPEEERLPQIVEWILLALEESNYKTQQIKNFNINNDINVNQIYEEEFNESVEEGRREYSSIPMSSPYIGLQLRGISDERKLDRVLNILQSHAAKATFYITTSEAEKYPDNIKKIIDSGCCIGNGGTDEKLLTNQSEEQVKNAIKSCNDILKDKYKIASMYFMPPSGKFDNTVLEVTTQEQMTLVTYNRCPIIKDGKTIKTIMKNFADSLSKGSLIYVNLDNYDESDEVIEQILSCAEKKEYQAEGIDVLFKNKTSDESLLLASIDIPKVLDINQIDKLRKNNDGKESYTINQIYTTERALSFTFSGISDNKALENIFTSMNKMGAKGTFFVTYTEMKAFPDRVKKIIENGNEIGIALIPYESATFESYCNEIAAAQNYMNDNFDMTPKLVMKTMSRTDNKVSLSEMQEAVHAMECRLIGHSISVVQSSLKGISSASSYYTNLTKSNFSVQRGQIIYTRLDYLSRSQILGNVLQMLKEDKIDPISYYDYQLGQNMWAYSVKSLSSVLYNTADGGAKLYSLNNGAGASEYISALKYDLSDNEMLMNSIRSGYIGNPDVTGNSSLPGFTDNEIKSLDINGKLRGNSNDNYVFLSFDDWGSDIAINHLLYVLDKYQLRATFFVRSNAVAKNPNLLRAIAEGGHQIGSHTSTHYKLSNEVDGKQYVYSSLSEEDATVLRDDIVQSYKEMYKIVGNYSPNGYLSLVPIFRPPTLAVSKIGLKQVFESGYQFSISGDFSTQDYLEKKADDGVNKLANKLQNGYSAWDGKRTIKSHSIVVMHMSDQSEVTAEAIQMWMENGARSKFNFDQPIYQYMVTH